MFQMEQTDPILTSAKDDTLLADANADGRGKVPLLLKGKEDRRAAGDSHVVEDPEPLPRKEALPLIHHLRHDLSALHCRLSALGRQSVHLGRWLETDVFPAARQAGHDTVTLDVTADGVIRPRPEAGLAASLELTHCPDLCGFLAALAIDRLELATRLESNQIIDIVTFLHTCRRKLTGRGERESRPSGPAGHLLDDRGLHLSCTQTYLRSSVLAIEYSYCTTRMSLAVRWFERRHYAFHDHRTLTHAAPRYGLIAAVMPALVFLAYALGGSFVLMLACTLLGALGLFVTVYVFFRGMGGIEYDNEEKAYRLLRAHAALQKHTALIHRDLARAREVQQKLLPDRRLMPLPHRLEWGGSFAPAAQVGGDYFDAAEIDDGKVAIVFADVSGHGMAAALVTVILKMTFQTWIEQQLTLTEFVRRANRDLCRLTMNGSFVVMMGAVYDDNAHRLHYVNCGHSPGPVHLPGEPDRPVEDLTPTGAMLLGVQEDIDVQEFSQPLGPGDGILFATDGLTEAMNADDELYGTERLVEILQANRHAAPEALIDALADDVSTFSAHAEQSDDRTILAFRVR